MRRCLILLAFSWATSNLTLTATVARAAMPQAQKQDGGGSKLGASNADAKRKNTKEKTADDPDPSSPPPRPHGVKALGKEFLLDQQQIWTSPAKLRLSDTQWLVPLSGITAGLFVTDGDYSRHISNSPSTISRYKNLSNAGIGALVGGAGGMWLLGHVKHNDHWSETGFLAGEAALNSLVAVESFKYSLRRERPYQGDGTGPFFQSGGTSFPSEHAAAAWSVAGVIAHEYPSPFVKIMAYGLASLVDYSRLRARQHFPSDVFVGSMMGNLIAQNIYSRNHDPELGGEAWHSVSQLFRSNGNLTPSNMGSPYVPMDSWVYSAFDRLAAMGYVKSGMLGMRPWTRLECVRLLNEAQAHNIEYSSSSEVEKAFAQLSNEFAGEMREMSAGDNRSAKVESLYSRFTGISGQPLTDGFNFGQTIVNNYGRPYQEGLNSADGFSAWATEGHLIAYVRAEYQHAPSAPALSASARQFISTSNSLPIVPPTPFASVNRFQLLDSYVGLNFSNWQFTFGPQTLWWGPSLGGPLMFSDDATPVNMLRINRVSPFKLPSILGWLGPWRLETFLGQLTGHDFVYQTNTGLVGQFGQPVGRQPFLDGTRFSFKPLPNFELGFSLTVVFAGGPTPLTAHTFFHSYSSGQGNGAPGNATDPGDRRSGLDFTLRIPGVKDGLSLYSEAFVEDEFSPIAYWRNAATWSGLYLAQVPKLNKLDFRVEAGYTDLPSGLQNGTPTSHYGPGIFYSNGRYPDGSYVNGGFLLGNWVGRDSQGVQAWSNYRFSPRSFIQASFRHQKVSQQFMPGGGTLTDAALSANVWLHDDLSVSGSVQYERWLYPIITPGAQTNVTTSLQLVFWPESWKK